MFSLVFFVVFAVAGISVFAYLWWKTRHIRKELKERQNGGEWIEGEAVVVKETEVVEVKALPPSGDKARSTPEP